MQKPHARPMTAMVVFSCEVFCKFVESSELWRDGGASRRARLCGRRSGVGTCSYIRNKFSQCPKLTVEILPVSGSRRGMSSVCYQKLHLALTEFIHLSPVA
jgi:hypothetical protein